MSKYTFNSPDISIDYDLTTPDGELALYDRWYEGHLGDHDISEFLPELNNDEDYEELFDRMQEGYGTEIEVDANSFLAKDNANEALEVVLKEIMEAADKAEKQEEEDRLVEQARKETESRKFRIPIQVQIGLAALTLTNFTIMIIKLIGTL